MRDREVSVSAGCVAAYLLWALSLTLCMIAWFVDSMDVGRFSLIVCGGAVTATIRTYFVAQHYRIKAALIVAATEPPPALVKPIR